ncbi:hypothetical protein BRC62_08240 [Halobacteriales archaeon QH_10_67_13]|nr:MAG: hypothetical protein BRC62_08240 [Halobacteriales archaeon QH_10_67_13]
MAETQHARRGEIGAASTAERRLTECQVHNLLRNERRRAVLRLLTGSSEPTVAVRDLAERIAAEETGTDPPPRETRQSVYISLIQTHMPTLADAGVVEYDDQAKTATETAAVGQLAPYTEELSADGPSTDTRQERSILAPALAVILASWLLSAGAVLSVPPFGAVSPIVWLLCGVVGVAALAAYDRL